MKTPSLLLRAGFALVLLSTGLLSAQSPASSQKVVEGDGINLDLSAVEQAAQRQLAGLELEKQQFEAGQLKKRYEILRQTMEKLVADQLIEEEAQQRGITPQALIQDVRSGAAEVTDEEVEQFWVSNQKRLKGTKEQMVPQIKRYLTQQKQGESLESFVSALEAQRQVRFQLDPVRFPVATEGFPAKGGKNAPVTIVEFSDFECPYCSRVKATLEQVLEKYGEQVRIVFRQFPLSSIHPHAQKAAEAALCAAEQGQFWKLHDWMFEHQQNLTVEEIQKAAAELSLDGDRFQQCLAANRFAAGIQMDVEAGMKVGVSGTPAFFVNGRPLSGAVAFDTIAQVIDEELARQP